MNECILKQKIGLTNSEFENRKKDICNTCWKKPLCLLRMKGDFHISECNNYMKNTP